MARRWLWLGIVVGVVFGAATVGLALRFGFTARASLPLIALSLGVLLLQRRCFSRGVMVGGLLAGVALWGALWGAQHGQRIANAVERLRGDGVRFDLPAGCYVTLDGLRLKHGQRLVVRSRWLSGELVPAVERASGWTRLTTVAVSAFCLDRSHDELTIEYDADAPVRTLRMTPAEAGPRRLLLEARPRADAVALVSLLVLAALLLWTALRRPSSSTTSSSGPSASASS